MRAFRLALWPAAFAFGLAAELAGQAPLPALDATTGFALLALGLTACWRRPFYAIGLILAAAGIAWFLGTIAGWAVFLDRGPLSQLILTYPARKLWPASRAERLAISAAYVHGIAYPVANNDVATIVYALALVGVALWRCLISRGPTGRARNAALVAAIAFSLVLIASAIAGLAGAAGGSALLAAYDATVMLLAAGLTADLLWGKWTEGLVARLVVDLGETSAAGALLGERLARTLGDPTLTIAYWVAEQDRYVDDAGRPIALPSHGSDRAVRLIDDAGSPLAALIHDPAVLDDSQLLVEVAAATRLAVTNARLQADIRGRVADVEASRRRLVTAADEQRRALEHELREGTEQRLAAVAQLLNASGPPPAQISGGLDSARRQLRELAHGIHPATLTEQGLHAAIAELATRSPLPVELDVEARRWPADIEGGAYYLCSEALTNVAKHADASRVSVRIRSNAAQLHVEIADDGTGSADPAHGSGLRGLTDRIEALGGQLTITSTHDRGTVLSARLPLTPT